VRVALLGTIFLATLLPNAYTIDVLFTVAEIDYVPTISWILAIILAALQFAFWLLALRWRTCLMGALLASWGNMTLAFFVGYGTLHL